MTEATLDLALVEAAAERLAGRVVRTPVLHSRTLSALTGAEVWLKFENHQFTASFKERGALNCLLQLSAGQARQGVIAMSAGNHAQALACHAEQLGIPAVIVMPRSTPSAKVAQTQVFGPEVVLHGTGFDDAIAYTEARAERDQLTLVHPYDDLRVMAGQGTVALELLADAPPADVVLIPTGGGGLLSGMATVLRARAPHTEVIGVQAERFAAVAAALRGRVQAFGQTTVAEGIAVKSPGRLTLPLIRRHVHGMVTVNEAQLEQAVLMLLEIEKTVVEGAGAAGLAAMLADPDRFRGRRVQLVLSGGNIDLMVLSSLIQRGLVQSGRLVRLRLELPDIPGALGRVCQLLGEQEVNIVDIQHQRAFSGSSVRATDVDFILQLRGTDQIARVLAALQDAGCPARPILAAS